MPGCGAADRAPLRAGVDADAYGKTRRIAGGFFFARMKLLSPP